MEDRSLAVFASRAARATRRWPVEGEGRSYDYRTEYQRDRDRIIHSRAFRRLKHKTQVFIPFEGDHYRTRLTHTLEVTQIGRTIARALGLNEDLTEACCLGHDLGHTPFGHSGEKVLNRILSGTEPSIPIEPKVAALAGAFKHNYQSVRVVDVLEKRYAHPGLNLTNDTREGILKHTTWRRDFPFPDLDDEGLNLSSAGHLEGQVTGWADEFAQQAHDLEDGLKLVEFGKVLSLPVAKAVLEALGPRWESTEDRTVRHAMLIRGMIHLLVTDLITATRASHRDVAHGAEDRDARRFLRAAAEAPRLARHPVEDRRALLSRAEGFHLPERHPQPPRLEARREGAARRHDALRRLVPQPAPPAGRRPAPLPRPGGRGVPSRHPAQAARRRDRRELPSRSRSSFAPSPTTSRG